MSEDNKDLGDKAEEAFDKAKDAAKDAADDVKEAAGKAKEKASEFAEDAKEAASDFASEAKESAKEFKDDVKEVFSSDNPESGKTIAIVAHLTLIGWIIALIMNSNNKSEIGSFYIRQVLGLGLLGILLSFIPVIGWIASIGVLVLWIMSLVGAFSGETKLTPFLGEYFQSWFKSL